MGRKTNKSLRSKNVKEYGEPKELTKLKDELGIPTSNNKDYSPRSNRSHGARRTQHGGYRH